MAAVARSPESPDAISARVPCPFCGGLLHPIAGRCKHCKQDLSSHPSRAFGPGLALSGNAPPPQLSSLPSLASLGSLPRGAARAVALGAPPAANAGQGRAAGAGWLRNWPLLVILVAVVGMIVALVLLVLPQRDGAIQRGKAPLSNDRMETDVLPNSGRPKVSPNPSAIDPWSSGTPSAPDPAPPDPAGPSTQLRPPPGSSSVDDLTAGIDPGADPDAVYGSLLDPDPYATDPADPDPADTMDSDPADVVTPDLVDPLAPTRPRPITPPLPENFEIAVISRLCIRSATCGDDPVMRNLCTMAMRQPTKRAAPRCYDARLARQCLSDIDELTCDVPPQMSALRGIRACQILLRC